MKVRVYVEGGGDGQALRTRCRRGFTQFFESAGLQGRMPSIVACRGRNDAYKSFVTALAKAGPNDFPMLLVDSEAAVNRAPWEHLKARDDWEQPEAAADHHAQLMVQCMEAWFLIDRQLLGAFFGQGFTENPLPGNPNAEQVPKSTIYHALKLATRQSRKGEYDKGEHSFEILGKLDPAKVAVAPHADRLLRTLDEKCS